MINFYKKHIYSIVLLIAFQADCSFLDNPENQIRNFIIRLLTKHYYTSVVPKILSENNYNIFSPNYKFERPYFGCDVKKYIENISSCLINFNTGEQRETFFKINEKITKEHTSNFLQQNKTTPEELVFHHCIKNEKNFKYFAENHPNEFFRGKTNILCADYIVHRTNGGVLWTCDNNIEFRLLYDKLKEQQRR